MRALASSCSWKFIPGALVEMGWDCLGRSLHHCKVPAHFLQIPKRTQRCITARLKVTLCLTRVSDSVGWVILLPRFQPFSQSLIPSVTANNNNNKNLDMVVIYLSLKQDNLFLPMHIWSRIYHQNLFLPPNAQLLDAQNHLWMVTAFGQSPAQLLQSLSLSMEVVQQSLSQWLILL